MGRVKQAVTVSVRLYYCAAPTLCAKSPAAVNLVGCPLYNELP